jgi:hypothetical protein
MKNDKLTNSDERKGPVEVAIQLGLSEKEATRNYTEYWRLAIPIQNIFAKGIAEGEVLLSKVLVTCTITSW